MNDQKKGVVSLTLLGFVAGLSALVFFGCVVALSSTAELLAEL